MSRITRDLTKETINKDDIYTNLNKLNESEHEMKMNWRQMLEWFLATNVALGATMYTDMYVCMYVPDN